MPIAATAAKQFARELAARFPRAGSHTLAKKAYQKCPELWPNLEACRQMIRTVRGKHGVMSRRETADKSQFDSAPRSNVPFRSLPEGMCELKGWPAFKIRTTGLWLVISDLHVPYHDVQAIRLCLSEARRRGVVGILINGDLADNYAVSRWERDPRERNYPREIEIMRRVFGVLRRSFKNADIIWKWGNHDERYDAYLQTKAPELLEVDDFDFARLTRADDNGITTVRDMRRIHLGKLRVIHGHEYKFSIQNPVNPARGLFLRAKVSSLCGHFHQPSSHSGKNLDGHVTTCWSSGCLCDLSPRYMPLNEWAHGACFVNVESNGAFSVENFRIIDGKIWD